MKLLLWVVVLVVIVTGMTFMYYNRDTTSEINLFGTEYPDVPTAVIVAASLLGGAILIGILALAEGAAIRLENRKLRREMHKLGIEVDYLRTTPPLGSARTEAEPPAPAAPARGQAASPTELASAPVYEAGGDDDEDWPPDPDDDFYSGGRAV